MTKTYYIRNIIFISVLLLFTACSQKTGTMTGNDGKVYKTVKIGNQVWMAENLRETLYRDRTAVHMVQDSLEWTVLLTGAYCQYHDDEKNAGLYGFLYNWHAVTHSANLAPPGWRMPSDLDWKELEIFLGMERAETDRQSWRGAIAKSGGKMKAEGAELWQQPNDEASNSSGFTALPGGYRNEKGQFRNLRRSALFWSRTQQKDEYAWSRYLNYRTAGISRNMHDKRCGFSVRLVKAD